MALTKIGTDGVKDDAVTSGKIPANAVGSSELADQSVSLDKLPHGTSSNDGKFLRANNGADPTFETVNTDLVADTSPQLGGDLDTNGHHILLDDNHQLRVGDGNDFNINHDSNDTYLTNSTGNLIVQQAASNSTGDTYNKARSHYLRVDGSNNDSGIDVIQNGAVNLYHNNVKKFETTSTGTAATGYLQQHNLVCVSYSDTRAISLSNVDLTPSNFYNYVNFESDGTILDSNGHFVAPVHGVYRLYFRCTTDSTSGNRANVRLRKNGNTVTEAYASTGSSGFYQSVSSEIVAELNANEYMDIQVAQLYTQNGNQHKQVIFQMLG